MERVPLNQSAGSRRRALFCISSVLFLPGILLLLIGGAASTSTVERGGTFFQHLHLAFVQRFSEELFSP